MISSFVSGFEAPSARRQETSTCAPERRAETPQKPGGCERSLPVAALRGGFHRYVAGVEWTPGRGVPWLHRPPHRWRTVNLMQPWERATDFPVAASVQTTHSGRERR